MFDGDEKLGDRTFNYLIDRMDEIGADRVVVKHCDDNGKVLFIALVATGDDAAAMDRYLDSVDLEQCE